MMVSGLESAGYPRHVFPRSIQKSHARKLAAPMAIPRPKMIPARAFLLPAFTEGEHQPAHDNGNQAESLAQ